MLLIINTPILYILYPYFRHYTARYAYVGGYYGGCNEDEMKKALVKNGPMAVAFEVYFSFLGKS